MHAESTESRRNRRSDHQDTVRDCQRQSDAHLLGLQLRQSGSFLSNHHGGCLLDVLPADPVSFVVVRATSSQDVPSQTGPALTSSFETLVTYSICPTLVCAYTSFTTLYGFGLCPHISPSNKLFTV